MKANIFQNHYLKIVKSKPLTRGNTIFFVTIPLDAWSLYSKKKRRKEGSKIKKKKKKKKMSKKIKKNS